MSYINKRENQPASIAEFLTIQIPVGVNLDYDYGFTRKPELRNELVAEQFGLCAYTGAPVDRRLVNIPVAGSPARFLAHIEHLKPQSICRQELLNQGKEPGIDIGEDMDYRNMVVALLVDGALREQFGAAIRADTPFPVWPTHRDCEARFHFDRDGTVRTGDADADATVEVLRLNHETLRGWRRTAIDVYLDPNVVTSREELENLIIQLDQPLDGELVEYCFCIKSAAQSMLTID